ncbi:MAG: M1 family aminopeptidase, partial [Deltaproteobacteria bacterium]
RAVLELESRSAEDIVLPFELSPRLRVLGVEDDEGHQLTLFPADAKQEPATGEERGNWIAVALTSPRLAGTRFRLTFKYMGNVITDAGNDVLYVGSRGSWYPNRGEYTRATFDLTFQYPESVTLVATGRRVEESKSGGWKHSRWVSDAENLMAGFNLGIYKSRERKVGNVRIEVYASKAAEAALQRLYADKSPSIFIYPGTVAEGMKGARIINIPPPPPLDPAALLDDVLSKAADSVQYFDQIFGPFPYSHLALAQIPGDFGQGWPGLVYLPTFSFLQGAEREKLSGHALGHEMDLGPFVAHEIAHQWWGNEVGWNSYHDQWLSEGFASYAAALALARERGGDRKLHELLQAYKRDLLAKKPDGETVESGGPIWLGQRLSNSHNPTGYNDIVYKKSCWVLHMLRSLMTDPKTGSDAQFFDVLRSFVRTYSGKNPTTEDLCKFLDRYVTPTLDLEHNHRLDWFFADWVYGTGIPEYKLDHKIRRLAPDLYVVEGEISQNGVPDEFEMLVPVVADGGGAKNARLGWVAVSNTGGKFHFTTKFRPSKVAIDDEDLLAVIK